MLFMETPAYQEVCRSLVHGPAAMVRSEANRRVNPDGQDTGFSANPFSVVTVPFRNLVKAA